MFTLISMMHYSSDFGHFNVGPLTFKIDYALMLYAILFPVYLLVDLTTGVIIQLHIQLLI